MARTLMREMHMQTTALRKNGRSASRAVVCLALLFGVLGAGVGPAAAGHLVNVPPVAGDDAYTTAADTPLTVAAPGVLGNDTDPDALPGDTMTAGSAGDPAGGSVTLNPNGSFTYTADAGFTGADTFTYTASDGHGGTDTATVTVTVTAPNPVTSVSGSAFGHYVNVGLFGGARNLRGAGSTVPPTDVSYSPSVTLPPGGSETAVTASDPDGAKGIYGPAVIFGGIWPDSASSAPSSGPLSASTQGTAASGSVTSSAEVRLHDTPQEVPCYTGYQAPCTAPGGFGPGPLVGDKATSTCTANASGVSGSSTFVNGKIETKYDSGTQLALPEFVVPIPANPPPNWTVSGTIDHVGDKFTIVINEQIIGPDSITVNAAHMYLLGAVARGDMVVGSSTCSLSQTVANGAPVAADEAFTTAEDTPLNVAASGLLANDSDPDGNTLAATNAQAVLSNDTDCCRDYAFPSDPPHGTATINGNGSLSYVPDPDFFGTDTFTYVARDPRGAWDAATVTVTVTPVPDTPVAGDDNDQTVRSTPLTVPAPGVLANDTDGDSDPLTAGSATDPPNGTVVLAADGSYTYTPDPGFLGTDTFTYTVDDGTGRNDTAMVTIVVTVDGATLVKDISAGSSSATPGGFRVVGDNVFIVASDAATGRELWKTDGTPAGTVLVKDILPGPNSSISVSGNITDFNGAVYFAASNGTSVGLNGTELWKSDGTAAGTVMVKDINPGTPASSPTNFRAVGSTLYFSANSGNGVELWKTDGTAAGTMLVKDINTTTTTASSSPSNLTAVGSTLFFSASTGTTATPAGQTGIELWKSDGTAAGTVQVKDIASGFASSSPGSFQVLGSTLIFRASNGAAAGQHGGELWKSDGTSAGTVMVKDINVGTAGSNPTGFTQFGTKLLFSANDGEANYATELWETDGTTAGTVMLANISATGHSTPGQFKVVGNTVFFSANGGTGAQGFELWKTDGTELGTVMVKDIDPGIGDSFPGSLTEIDGVVYFAATTAAKGRELWKTDGTAAGTVLTEDVNPGSAGSGPSSLTPALGTMLFNATDVVNGSELWRLPLPPAPPVAVDDTYSTGEDIPLTVAAPGVLGNDTDVNGDSLTAGSASAPANGTVTLNANGSFTYTPNANFAGTDSFTYTVSDGNGGTDTGSVAITITAVNDAPVAGDDAHSTNEDTPLTVAAPGVLGNDTDADGNGLSAAPAGAPSNGTVTLNADGSFTYTPNAGFAGTDTFTYTVSDGQGGSDTGTVTITIAAVNDAPAAVDDTYSTAEDTAVTVAAPGVLANDTDANGDALTAGSAGTPANGTVALNADGSFTYTPNAGFGGADSFTYTVSDGNGGSDTATATITVAAVNDAPVAVDDTATTSENAAVTVAAPGVLGNDSDVDGDALSAGSASDPAGGSVALNADGSFTYTPDAGFSGTDTFTYTASDGRAGTDTATVTMTVTPPPAATGPTTLSVSSVDVFEGNSGTTEAVFTVTRSGDASGTTTVTHKTSGGTATAGTDYTAILASPLTFGPGETSKQVTVNVTGDTAPEKAETFSLTISGPPKGTLLGDPSGAGTILNDDDAAYLSAENVVVSEGNAGATSGSFTVTRSGNTSAESTVKAKVGGGTATAGADYTAVAEQTLTFAAGDTSETVTFDVLGDTAPEANETFNLALSLPSAGTTVADASTTAYIDDDDGTTAAPASTFFSVNSLSLNEGDSGTSAATFTVTRYGSTTTEQVVSYKTSAATATAGVDFTAATGPITFGPGETTKTVTIDVIGETAPEKDETFNLTLFGQPRGTLLGDAAGTATIINDDGASYVAVSNVHTAEGSAANTVEVTVTRSGNTTSPATVKAKTGGGTATPGGDYNTITEVVVSFGAGETTKTVTVTVNGDTAVEPNETFNVTLFAPGPGVTLADAAGTVTIVNDD